MTNLGSVNYRVYTKADKQQVLSLILDIQQHEFAVKITAADQPDLQAITTFYQSGKGNFWVAVDNERIVGTIALLDINNQQLALRKMFVAKAYRGSKTGVAENLLNQCHAWALGHGVTDIYLGTINVYYAAMRFYEKHGYQRIQKIALPNTFPLIAVDNVFYHKVIDSSQQGALH